MLYGMQHLLDFGRTRLDPFESVECTGKNDETCKEEPSKEEREDAVQSRDLLELHVRV